MYCQNGETCLHMAARSGAVKLVEQLVKSGLHPDIVSQVSTVHTQDLFVIKLRIARDSPQNIGHMWW